QQRVALARALVFEPRVVLMDEPLGALDKQLREQMQLDIRELHRRLGLTIVFVTHDQSEALTMSDRVAVFNKGKIEQIGTPRQVYDEPATRFVAEFIGETNLVEGVVEAIEGREATVRLPNGAQIVSAVSDGVAAGQGVYLSIRPERIDLAEARGAARNVLETEVTDSVYQGDHLRVQLQNEAYPLIAKLGRRSREFAPGTKVFAAFSAGDCRVIAQ
ncbi:ABC transporter ATP-binding protein, partial [Shinella sp.]